MTSRLQLALAVESVDAASRFYAALFGATPHKIRPGYANFVLSDPPLKLVLIEHPGAGGGIDHLGVEVTSTAEVDDWQRRLGDRGLASRDERDTVCCHARQDKFWVQDAPDGARWEVYTVLDDAPDEAAATSEAGDACCADTCCA